MNAHVRRDTLRFVEEITEDGNAWRLSDAAEDYRAATEMMGVVPGHTL